MVLTFGDSLSQKYSGTLSYITFIIFVLLAFSGVRSFAQGLPIFDNIKLEQKTDFKSAEPYALEAATYLLSTPYLKDDLDRLKSLQFVIKWMSGTPDYLFTVDDVAGRIIKGNEDELLGLYMAAMTKYSLENKVSAGDVKLVKLNSIILLLNYCEDPANHIKMSKNLKKLSEAKAKGRLEQEL
jgi:hypothetical protein